MTMRRVTLTFALLAGCASPDKFADPTDPNSAPVAPVDRFGSYGTLFNRDMPAFNPALTAGNLPGPDEPIDMDAMFLVHALGPTGEPITYYGLDFAPALPALAYELVDESGALVADQLPLIETLPGDDGYNDFVHVQRVHVGNDYPANSFTSVSDIEDAVAKGIAVEEPTTRIENWALVPKGTTATRNFDGVPTAGYRAWHDGRVAHLLRFDSALALTSGGAVPQSTVIVIFENGTSPAEGFATEPDGVQTHNVVETLPGVHPKYSSLWIHRSGDPLGFDGVTDFASAEANAIMVLAGVLVNCPVVAP